MKDRAREVELAADREEWENDSATLADERNALAREMRQTYPHHVAELVSLFARAADLDHRISEFHGRRPDGCKGYLKSVEQTARELEAFTRDTPSLVARDRLQLPDWSDTASWLGHRSKSPRP